MSSPAPAADGHTLCVAVLGLGEAGSIFAAGIAAGPADVRGFDPADVATPAGCRCPTWRPAALRTDRPDLTTARYADDC